MSQENVGVVRRCFEHFSARRYAELEEDIHADFVLDLERNIFNPATYRGFKGLLRWVEEIYEVWSELNVTVNELVDRGEFVIADVRIDGRGGGSGAEAGMRLFQVWEFREGKVATVTGGLRDRDEALEAAGLSE